MSFEDKTIVCADCGQEFVHSADDQTRYAERGFTNEPKRCRPCREKRKAQAASKSPATANATATEGGEAPARPSREGFARPGQRPRGTGRPPARGTRTFRSNSGERGGGPREFFDAVCAACGVATKVPFKPNQGRPVYCRDCYRAKKP